MPFVRSTYAPPFFLRGAHVQTILGAVLPRGKNVRYERERLELADGDFLDLDWSRVGSDRLVILTQGLEGEASDSITRGLAASWNAAGWDALAWNYRGCSGEPNRLPRFYHGADTTDLVTVIEHAAGSAHAPMRSSLLSAGGKNGHSSAPQEASPTRAYAGISLVGLSLGGSIVLRYLGECGAHSRVTAAAAVSAPVDLASSALKLDAHPHNRFYLRRLINRLHAKVERKAPLFPDVFETTSLGSLRTFATFDNRYTAPLHGFRNATEYWAQACVRPYLASIQVPTLLLSSVDDPFLTPESFPVVEASDNPNLFLEAPRNGGHLGFMDARGSWLERRILSFLQMPGEADE
jgi:hypothetical protein